MITLQYKSLTALQKTTGREREDCEQLSDILCPERLVAFPSLTLWGSPGILN